MWSQRAGEGRCGYQSQESTKTLKNRSLEKKCRDRSRVKGSWGVSQGKRSPGGFERYRDKVAPGEMSFSRRTRKRGGEKKGVCFKEAWEAAGVQRRPAKKKRDAGTRKIRWTWSYGH